jgi:lysophospholipase L1-like esterase
MKLASCAVVFLLTLAACGNEDEPGPTIVAALGDSITEGAPLLNRQSEYGYWAEMRLRGTRFRHCGVSGERTDQIAARLDECAEGAEVLIVQGGINDIAQRRPVEPAAANLREIVRRGKALGLPVAIANVMPWNNGHPAADAPIRELNHLIDELGVAERILVLPFYATLEDSAAPGRMRPEWTSDGDHPSVEGYRRLGELAFRLP